MEDKSDGHVMETKCLICLDKLSLLGLPTIKLLPCSHSLWYQYLLPSFTYQLLIFIVRHVSCSITRRVKRISALLAYS